MALWEEIVSMIPYHHDVENVAKWFSKTQNNILNKKNRAEYSRKYIINIEQGIEEFML
jgi:hypothetical protein